MFIAVHKIVFRILIRENTNKWLPGERRSALIEPSVLERVLSYSQPFVARVKGLFPRCV
jgi:hypothetical protein